MTNFLKNYKQYVENYCNLYYALYLESLWGMRVGYRTEPAYKLVPKLKLAEWQRSYDCSNSQCIASHSQQVTVQEVCALPPEGTCSDNPALSPLGCEWRHWWGDFNFITVPTYYR